MHRKVTETAVVAISMLLAVAISPVQAQKPYPAKPITMVVPFVPGGPTDLLARIAAEGIRKNLGATVVVDNKPGAGGSVAAKLAIAGGRDGYTLMFGTAGTHALNGLLYSNAGYDPIADFAPIAAVASSPNLLVVSASLPIKTIKELVDYSKAHPGKMSYGSGGFGTSTHLAAELFTKQAGLTIKHVPYKGTAPALADLAAGHISLVFDSIGTALAQTKGGQIRAVAVTTPKRSLLRPDLPTVAESGYPSFDVTVYYGLFAPTGVPADIVTKLNDAVNAYLKTPEIQERYKALGLEPLIDTPEALGQAMRAEKARWEPIIKEANIKIE